jgi:DNA-binding HxlR family transcriptional regulator
MPRGQHARLGRRQMVAAHHPRHAPRQAHLRELAQSPEGIPTNILADRLRRLEEAGIIESAAYQERPVLRIR